MRVCIVYAQASSRDTRRTDQNHLFKEQKIKQHGKKRPILLLFYSFARVRACSLLKVCINRGKEEIKIHTNPEP